MFTRRYPQSIEITIRVRWARTLGAIGKNAEKGGQGHWKLENQALHGHHCTRCRETCSTLNNILSRNYEQPCAPSLFLKNSLEGWGADIPFFGPIFPEIGSDHHTEHDLLSLVKTAPNGDPKHTYSELVFHIKWHAVPPDSLLTSILYTRLFLVYCIP